MEIGFRQIMKIDEIVDFGALLISENEPNEQRILLPNNQLTEVMTVGTIVDVFIYRDSEDRIIATCEQPYAEVGDLAILEVVGNADFGAFLDWGLAKDVFVPMREQVYDMKIGKRYLVRIYIDKTDRVCATTKVHDFLKIPTHFKKGDKVNAIVYNYSFDLGYFIAIDNKYKGLIPSPNKSLNLEIGDEIEVNVIRITEDDKADFSLYEGILHQMDEDSKKIYDFMKNNDGILNLHDKSDPDEIRNQFEISKKAFKRATGKMFKNRLIERTDNGWKIKK